MANESIETKGRTVDEAVRVALEELGVTRDDVEVEILAEGRAGVFGMGSQEARVRVTVLDDEDEEDDDYASPNVATRAVYVDEDDGDDEDEEAASPEIDPAQAETARETLEHMLDLLEFPNIVSIHDIEQERGVTNIRLDVNGDDVGLLIGRHGETLTSLQFVLNACLSKELGRNNRVIVDVEGYRERREQSLRGIAQRTADRVRRERRAVTLPPMTPSERRIIHLTLQSSPWVSTESTGEGADRRVVISPKGSSTGGAGGGAGGGPGMGRRPGYNYPRGMRG